VFALPAALVNYLLLDIQAHELDVVMEANQDAANSPGLLATLDKPSHVDVFCTGK
jgi:hypothetical protein